MGRDYVIVNLDDPKTKKKTYSVEPVKKKIDTERSMVEMKMSRKAQNLYWLFRRLTMNGARRVAIKDKDIAELTSCSARALFYNLRLLAEWGILEVEKISHKGRARQLPRKVYRFRGITHEEIQS